MTKIKNTGTCSESIETSEEKEIMSQICIRESTSGSFLLFFLRYGRKNTLLASYVLSLTFGFSSAFASSYVLFAVLRFLTGFGLTGISITSLILSKPPRSRCQIR